MRLTRKDKIGYFSEERACVIPLDNEIPDKFYSSDITKLGQLEDIEEELDIDLITLSKLFKSKEVYAYSNKDVIKCSNDGVSVYSKTITIYNGTCVIEYPLSEYGKSFALTKEELEK